MYFLDQKIILPALVFRISETRAGKIFLTPLCVCVSSFQAQKLNARAWDITKDSEKKDRVAGGGGEHRFDICKVFQSQMDEINAIWAIPSEIFWKM